jgi:uncharacterized protein involved in exopolysaccharide biosynthesis
MNVIELVHALVQRRRFIIAVTLAVMLLTAAVSLLIPSAYRSRASILPAGSSDEWMQVKKLTGLLPDAAVNENSSELFPEVLRSYAIRDAVLEADYHFAEDGKPQTVRLAEYFDQDNPDDLRKSLAAITDISVAKQTGVIELAVETRYPGLSQAVVSEYLKQLEHYNLHTRASRAKQYATYLERESESARLELEAAEDKLSEFQSANREWASTTNPDLSKELNRLQRDVTLETAKFSFLRQELESAQLDVQKDTPILRILDQPTLPTRRASPRRTLITCSLGIIAFLFSVAAVIAKESLDQSKANAQRGDACVSALVSTAHQDEGQATTA